MAISAPDLYRKTADRITAEIEAELRHPDIGWDGPDDGPGRALIRLFGRLAELAVTRLNRVPDKHFFAFLNAAGLDYVPPAPATVTLAFTMNDEGPAHVIVPKGARMATTATERLPEIVFETDRDMTLCPNRLTAAFAVDRLRVSDVTDRALGRVLASYPAFSGDRERVREVYLADPSLFVFDDDTHREAATVTLTVEVETPGDPSADGWSLSWSTFDGKGWSIDLTSFVTEDQTRGFRKSGRITFSRLPVLCETEIGGRVGVFIRCALTGGDHRDHLPTIRSISGSRMIDVPGTVLAADSLISAVQSGTTLVPQEQVNDFFPFGRRPSRLDAFYLRLDEALNKAGSVLGLAMAVDHAPDNTPTGLVVTVIWEYFGNDGWSPIYDTAANRGITPIDFTRPGRQTSRFTTPEDIRAVSVGGKTGYWIRARITAGSFESPGYLDQVTVGDRILPNWVSPRFYAPIIADLTLTLTYRTDASPVRPLSSVLGAADGWVRDLTADLTRGLSVAPFEAREEGPAFYLGLARVFPAGQWIQIHIEVDDTAVKDGETPPLVWEYDTGKGFCPLRTSDGTDHLTRTGYLGFFAPDDHPAGTVFGVTAHFIRAVPDKAAEAFATPALHTIRLNTVPATNAETVKDLILGSSDGKADQCFSLPRTPVHAGVRLVVSEPDIPPDEELKRHGEELARTDAGTPAVLTETGGDGTIRRWVRWIEVSDFFSSRTDSRHFTVDPVTGQVRFGDGTRGAIPPAGINNVKALSFRRHNGAKGNVGPHAVTAVQNPGGVLAHIDSVTNPEAATGGSDGESLEAIRERGPQRLKHRERAVTWEDYEWLAREAGSEIRSAACFPVTDSLGRHRAGEVTVVIIPESRAAKPAPGPALIRRVRSFLETHALLNLHRDGGIHVKGPDYVSCTVKARVVPVSPDSADRVELDILSRLDAFLNPLNGDPGQTVRRLGRDVFLSEISAQIEAVPGVDHVASLTVFGSLQQYTLYPAVEDGAYRILPYDLSPDCRAATFDERICLLLADGVRTTDQAVSRGIRALTVYGFKTDDTVAVVDDAGICLREQLVIASVSDTRIGFTVPFEAPLHWERRCALVSADRRLKLPLASEDNVITHEDGRVAGLIVRTFEPGDRVCLVRGTLRDPALEFIPLDRVEPAVSRVFVPKTCLVYPGDHDIDMVLE
ncbi:hypothetical protein JCM14469_16100 [Desulfatiferula olefinivorans]